MLSDAIKDIEEKIEEKINDEVKSDGLLEKVATVAKFDAVRSQPRAPVLWILTDTAYLHDGSTANREVWVLPFILIAVTQDSRDPEAGQQLATKLAANARSAVLTKKAGGKRVKDHTMGVDCVDWVKSIAFDPRTKFRDEGSKYSAGTTIEVTFTVTE